MKTTKFFCRAETKEGTKLFGYRHAPTSELALACFLQDYSLSEGEVENPYADTVDLVQMDRLLGFIDPNYDPWGCTPKFNISRLVSQTLQEGEGAEIHDDQMGGVTNPDWHVQRILWLIEHSEYLEDPISMDNKTTRDTVIPCPVILDGWHRIFAHRALKRKTIPVMYGGRVDLKDYLTGKLDTPPED